MFDLSTLSLPELQSLIESAKAEVSKRNSAMRVSLHFDRYNDRRYSKPWIATIASWPVGGRAELIFGAYLGTANGGDVEIAAKIGDIIRAGQKDHRGNTGRNEWYVVEADGSLRMIDEVEARNLYK